MKIVNKIIEYKQIEYKNNILYVSNNIDNANLNKNIKFLIGYIVNNNFSKITIFDVLNHSAGLVSFTTNFEQLKLKKYKKVSNI